MYGDRVVSFVLAPQEARTELEAVRNKAPREPQVYLFLGRVCKAMVRQHFYRGVPKFWTH